MSHTPTASDEKAKRVELIIAQLDSLPTLPAVATKLLHVTSDSRSNVKQVTELIESDQSLTAKILSLVRRASVGVASPVTTVERAVVLLGFDAVRSAALSIKVFETFGPHAQEMASAFDRTEFWKHSLAVACAAHLIAQSPPRIAAHAGRIDPEEAFVCGLLHDLGKVALDACLPKSFDRVVRLTDGSYACIADVERQLLGLDHTVVGRRLAELWELPEPILQSMWLHHHGPDALPPSITCAGQVQVTHLADLIARHQRIGYSGNWPIDEDPQDVAERMGIAAGRYRQIVEALGERIEERAEIIGLAHLSSKELYAQGLAKANDELARLNASLSATNRRLERRSRYFQALSHLTESVSLRAPMQQACVAAAESIRMALDVSSVLAFARRANDGYVELALVDPTLPQDVREVFSPVDDDCLITAEMDEATAEAALGGAWVLPAAPQAQALVDRYAGQLGLGPYWLVPIIRNGQWVGGAVFSAPAKRVADWRSERDELAALATSIGLLMTHILDRQAADRLSEDLADVGRRLQQAQGQLLRTRSLSMIAEMASGAAHELNNPLAIITGRAQLLRSQATDPDVQKTLELINEQALRCSEIVSELMDFARPQPPRPEAISLATMLAKLRASWTTTSWLTEDRFRLQLSDALPSVWCDAAQLEQVLDELISNAVQAMEPKEGRLAINCRTEASDDKVVLTVVDNGHGMQADVLRRAFDPFFSHRPAGRNRGLGLARAFRLVESNGGRLRLESTPGRGTTAILVLPTGQRDSVEGDSTTSPPTT